jgi:beta-lactamase regulating signal transducer with metallopeptidase domain
MLGHQPAKRLARRTLETGPDPTLGRPATPAAPSRRTAAARRFAVPALLGLGALAVAGLTALRFVRFRRLVSLSEPAPRGLDARAAELALGLGIRHPPPVRLVAARIPPVLWPASSGPLLLLPRDLLPELSDEERDALLAHELAHVLRRDHWVRFLEIAATALFWWYPVTWWARRALRRAEERCCDEWVLRALPASAHAYANGILKSLTFIADAPVALPAAASGAGPIEDLEARLKEILMTHPLPRLSRPIRFVLGATALASLSLFPTVAPPGTAQAAAVTVLPETDATPRPDAPPAPAPSMRGSSAPLAPPAPAPRASVQPRPAPVVAAPPAPAPFPGGNVRAPLAPVDEERDPALEAERQALDEQRRQLHRSQVDLERRSLELEARVQQKELTGEAARLRAEGDADGAARVEKRGALNARRVDLERRQLDLQVQQLGLEAELERVAREAMTGEKGPASDERRRGAEQAERELEKKSQALEAEVEQLERQMQALDAETRVHELRGATEELARSLAGQIASLRETLPEAGAQKAELEREIDRLEAALGALKGGATKAKAPRPSTPGAR